MAVGGGFSGHHRSTVQPIFTCISGSGAIRRSEDLSDLRRENATAIILGGIISMSIVITSATNVQGSGVTSVMDMAQALEPLLGAWAPYILGLGLFAAGISSAITAPLATALRSEVLWAGQAGYKTGDLEPFG